MNENEKRGILSVVGIGPGHDEHITPKALEAIADADMVVGYTTYIKLVKHLIKDKQVVKTGMTEEIGRAKAAIEEAQKGKKSHSYFIWRCRSIRHVRPGISSTQRNWLDS